MNVVEVTAEAIASNGDGVARTGLPRPLHVPGLLPGECASVSIRHSGRQRAHGAIVALVDPHPLRRAPPCRRQRLCSGCPLMIADESLQADMKRAFLADVGIAVDEVRRGSDALGYRWSAKRVVGGTAGALRLGSWRRGTHELADMDACLVDHPDIARCVDELKRVGSEQRIAPYDETRKEGDLRYVWFKTDGAGRVLVTLVTASERTEAHALAQALREPSGIAWCVQAGTGNAMRGTRAEILCGEPRLELTLCGEVVSVGPLGFLQPNPRVLEDAYLRLVGEAGTEEMSALAVDLYAGAGVTTRLLRRRFGRVLACETDPEGAEALGIPAETADAFLESLLAKGEAPRLVIANPPRAGLGESVCDKLVALAPQQLHVMSCDPETMARDITRLRERFTLVDAIAYDTLPQTAHVEIVVRFEKDGPHRENKKSIE